MQLCLEMGNLGFAMLEPYYLCSRMLTLASCLQSLILHFSFKLDNFILLKEKLNCMHHTENTK